MTLVKAVACELEDHVPEVFGFLFGQTFLLAAAEEFLSIGSNQRFLLLADCLNTRIRFGQFDSAQAVQNTHDLFLVHHNAVGFGQDFLKDGVQVFRLFFLVLDRNVLVDHPTLERTGTVQSIGRDDVAKVVGLHALKQVANPATFQLEYPFGFPSLEQIKRRNVVEWEVEWIDSLTGGLLDDIH